MSRLILSSDLPCVMGILNATPDSFSDGLSKIRGTRQIYEVLRSRLETIIAGGATVVDIGGESTRPDAIPIGWEEEWSRVETILHDATSRGSICVSVDTRHVETAELALKSGANIINDVEGTIHFEETASIIKGFDAHLIVVHNSRKSDSFQKLENPVQEIISEFSRIIQKSKSIGFDFQKLIFDPGIGFGKTDEQNFFILKNIGEIVKKIPCPIVCAVSKKSFLKKISGDARSLEALTTAATLDAYSKGCQIFRVHDVAENVAVLNFVKKIS